MPPYGSTPRSVYPGENAYLFGSIDHSTPPAAGVADNPEVAEPLVVSKSLCICVAPLMSGQVGVGKTITWETTYPSAPASGLTIALQGAMRDIEAEYTDIDTSTAVGGEIRRTASQDFKFFRGRVGAFTGGTNPTVIMKMKASQ